MDEVYQNQLEICQEDVSEIKKEMIPPLEFEDLMARVKYVEEKNGHRKR